MLSGHGDVTNLEIAAGESTISEPVLRLEHELAMDRGSDLLRVDHLGVTSTTLTAEVNGTVKELSSRRLLDLRGTYQADWDHLTPLLHELAPSSADVFALSGTTGSEFQLTGPLHEPVAVPGYRELEAGAAVGWSAGDVLGIELGKADVPLVLEAARVDVPVTQITASGGMLRLGGTVDLQGSEPVYRLLGRTMVLENVQVDREVGQRFLSRVNPIFADLAHLEGTLSLALEDVELPLGEGLATSGQGRGRLALSNLRLEPTGLLQTIMALEGVPASAVQSAKVSDLNFVIRDGRILYDDLLITLTEKLDLLFHGSVGLDGTQELWVSVPVRAALLQKLGAKGPLEEYAQLLAEENARVDIPILGERLHSSLGMANIGPLMEKAAGAYVKKLAREGLEGRLKGEEERTPAEEGATPEPGGAPTESIPKEVPAPPGSEEKEPADEDLRQRGRGLLRQLIPREETQAGEEGN